MATIQIRDVPEDVYERIREQARAAGSSLQAFMLDQVVEMARSSARRAAAISRLQDYLDDHGGAGATAQEIVDDVHRSRR